MAIKIIVINHESSWEEIQDYLDKLDYMIEHDEENNEFIGFCEGYPELYAPANTPNEAYELIMKLVEEKVMKDCGIQVV